VSNPSELLPQPRAAIAGDRARSLPFWFLSAAIIIYLSILFFGLRRGYEHLHAVLLLLQYLLILPAIVGCLRRRQDQDKVQAATELPRINLYAVIVCFAALVIPLSWFSARGLMHSDESGYSFQARIYRSGRLMADPLIGATSNVAREIPRELVYTGHVLRPYGWFPKFPPGWPLVLTLGYLISARCLLNPIFGVMQLMVIAALGWRCFSRESGVIAAFMAALSSFYLVNSVGMMSHAFCAILAATATLCLFAGLETANLWYYAGMFACLAATLQVRPYTGFVVTLVLTVAALWFNRKNQHTLVRVFAIGVFFGALSIAGVLVYNHLYSGSWLLSPYAMAHDSSLPPELSFSPGGMLRSIRRHALHTSEENLIGIFSFAYLLAGYALWRETTRHKEVWILASIYVALVLAYLAHTNDSGEVFFGERFHFEGFFALALVAARGLQLLVERWRTQRWALVWTMLLLGIMQLAQQAAAVNAIARRGEPYRKVREAIAASGFSGLVLLHDSPEFVAEHFNLNEADWRHAPRIYLLDAEPERRAEWACRYGVPAYAVVSYDELTRSAILLEGKANCTAVTDQQ